MATAYRSQPADPVESTEVALPARLLAEARALGIDVDAACVKGLSESVRKTEQARQWAEENQEAIAAHNAWVEENGLPLERYRMF
jgi:antitoxin CcdA